MTEKLELFRCNICKNIVEIVERGEGSLVCCNQEMENLKENLIDETNPHFAHVEKINDLEKRIFFNHEMTPEHHILFVEVISNDKKYVKRKYFNIDETPELILKCDCKEGYYVRVYCNIHNLCMTKI